MNSIDFFVPLFFVGVFGVVAGFSYSQFERIIQHDKAVMARRMQECQETGRKEFECYAMLKSDAPVAVPYFVPVAK